MSDSTQVTEFEATEEPTVIEMTDAEIEDATEAALAGTEVIEVPVETEAEREARLAAWITPTPGQLANEAKTEELKALAAEALSRAQGANKPQPEPEPKIEASTVIMCDDGQPILTPAEVRSMRDGLGISRPMLIELSGINGYRCWAAEQPHKADEPDVIEWRKIVSVVLRRVDEHGLPAEIQPKKRGRKPGSLVNTEDTAQVEELESRVNELMAHLALTIQALTDISEVKSLKEAKAKATAVLEILNAEDDDDTTEA